MKCKMKNGTWNMEHEMKNTTCTMKNGTSN
jgi:hypothetical protein